MLWKPQGFFPVMFSDETADGLDPKTRGDEHELTSEHALDIDDDAPKIPEDFYYSVEEHVSQAMVTEGSGLPQDLLQLQYPFLKWLYYCLQYMQAQ